MAPPANRTTDPPRRPKLTMRCPRCGFVLSADSKGAIRAALNDHQQYAHPPATTH